MKRIRCLSLMAFVILGLVLLGCGGRTTYISPYRIRHENSAREKADLARKYFEAGKQNYFNFKFYDSIRYLQQAISYESSDTNRARYYLYIGANYFYLENIGQARHSFSQAKKYDPALRPPRTEFPGEIVKTYLSAP